MIIDGHNDLVLHRWRGEPTEHLDLRSAQNAGFAGGFFALYVPSPPTPDPDEIPYALPLADADPARGGGADRRGALRRAVRPAGRARDVRATTSARAV